MHLAPRLRPQSAPRLPAAPAPRAPLRPAPWPESGAESRPVGPHSPDACLPLRPAVPLRPVRTPPGTVPFADAAQAWFWTVAALAARHGAGIGHRSSRSDGRGGPRVQRPCDPDDVIRALDLLYRRGGIGPLHARVLRRWGERFTVPPAGGTAAADAELWAEAMAQLDGVLRPKGILA